jgi:hypothetical protein
LKGVRNIEKAVENAVSDTDKAVFPFAKWVIKLETFPPGHAATKNIPNATEGGGLIRLIKIRVNRGRKKNWDMIPNPNDFGFWAIYRKSETLRSKDTPNIMTARERFSSSRES